MTKKEYAEKYHELLGEKSPGLEAIMKDSTRDEIRDAIEALEVAEGTAELPETFKPVEGVTLTNCSRGIIESGQKFKASTFPESSIRDLWKRGKIEPCL